MATKELKSYSLAKMKDKYIGKVGTKERDEYEYELRMDVLGKMIKTARQERTTRICFGKTRKYRINLDRQVLPSRNN